MSFIKKTWKDRISQYPDRRTFVDVNTGVAFTADVQRAEGDITEPGTQLNATNFNDLETRLSDAFSGTQDKLIAGTSIRIQDNVISISLTDGDTARY
jgi:ABC-type transport system substrate-binding protein